MTKRPLILITNDDGIDSPGLKAAACVAASFGDVIIAAPHTQQTGMGRAFPRTAETGIIEEVKLDIETWRKKQVQELAEKEVDNVTAYAVHGSPAYAVAYGVMELAARKPDLCVSGINYGENLGTTLSCSGTFGAALEANSHGIPAIAISLEADLAVQRLKEYVETDWSTAQTVLETFLEKMLGNSAQAGNSGCECGRNQWTGNDVDVWNINVPVRSEEPLRYRVTTQSRQSYYPFVRPEPRDRRQRYELPAHLHVDMESLEKESDIHALYVDRIVSATPLRMVMAGAAEELVGREEEI